MADPALHKVEPSLAASLSALETCDGAGLTLLEAAEHFVFGQTQTSSCVLGLDIHGLDGVLFSCLYFVFLCREVVVNILVDVPVCLKSYRLSGDHGSLRRLL